MGGFDTLGVALGEASGTGPIRKSAEWCLRQMVKLLKTSLEDVAESKMHNLKLKYSGWDNIRSSDGKTDAVYEVVFTDKTDYAAGGEWKTLTVDFIGRDEGNESETYAGPYKFMFTIDMDSEDKRIVQGALTPLPDEGLAKVVSDIVARRVISGNSDELNFVSSDPAFIAKCRAIVAKWVPIVVAAMRWANDQVDQGDALTSKWPSPGQKSLKI